MTFYTESTLLQCHQIPITSGFRWRLDVLRNSIHALVLNTCDSLITVLSWRHLPLITGANCNLPLAETEYVWQGEENHWITPVIARFGWLSFVIHCSSRSPVPLWDRKLLMSGPRAHCFLKALVVLKPGQSRLRQSCINRALMLFKPPDWYAVGWEMGHM